MGRPFWDFSLSLLLFLPILFFLPYILLLFMKNLKGQKTERRASNTDDRKSLLPGSHRRFSKTGRTGTTIVLSEPGQQWTHEASENSRRKTQAYGVNDQWRQSLNFQKLLQGTDCKHLQLQFWGSQVQNEHQHFEEHTPVKVLLWKLPIKPGLR